MFLSPLYSFDVVNFFSPSESAALVEGLLESGEDGFAPSKVGSSDKGDKSKAALGSSSYYFDDHSETSSAVQR
jgi:hypothetical protein